MLFVHCWLWKAPLQWSKPSLSLVSMAWARCLTISKEWSCSTRPCQEHRCLATRTERSREEQRGRFLGLLYVAEMCNMWVCNTFYSHFAFIGEFCCLPRDNRSNSNSFFPVTVPSLPFLPIFEPHTPQWLTARWNSASYSSRSLHVSRGCGRHGEHRRTHSWRRLAGGTVESMSLDYRVRPMARCSS